MKYLGIKLQKICKSYIINSIKLVRKIKGDLTRCKICFSHGFEIPMIFHCMLCCIQNRL